MRSFWKVVSLLLIGMFGGALGVSYFFNIPININPITVVNTGNGDVDIDNNVRQGSQPSPSASPTTQTVPAAPPPSTQNTAENEGENGVPTTATQQPQLTETNRSRAAHSVAGNAADRSIASNPPPTFSRTYEEEQPTDVGLPKPSITYRRACPPVIVQRAAPEEDYIQPSTISSSPRSTVSSSSSSSSVTVVNGRVVSRSSVTVVNGRVVSRSVYPPPSDDDDW